jgi:hypothetical protein
MLSFSEEPVLVQLRTENRFPAFRTVSRRLRSCSVVLLIRGD